MSLMDAYGVGGAFVSLLQVIMGNSMMKKENDVTDYLVKLQPMNLTYG